MVIQQDEIDPKDWCKFQAVDSVSFLIISFVLVALCFLFCLFLRSLTIRVQNKVIISRQQSLIFKMMGLWFTIGFIKHALNIIVYATFQKSSVENSRPEIILSAFTLFLDKLSPFALHSILIKIPCLWINNTVMKLNDKQHLSLIQRKRIDFVFNILKCMRYYFKIRISFIIIHFCFCLSMAIWPYVGKYSNYLILVSITQAIVAIFIYTLGIISLHRFNEILRLPKQILKNVYIQYILLVFCCVSRLTFNWLYFLQFQNKYYQPLKNCIDGDNYIYYVTYIYLTVGYTLTHLIPITTIILIYWPDVERRQRKSFSINDLKLLGPKIIFSNSELLGSIQTRRKASTDSQIDTMSQIQTEQRDKRSKPYFRKFFFF